MNKCHVPMLGPQDGQVLTMFRVRQGYKAVENVTCVGMLLETKSFGCRLWRNFSLKEN